MWDGAKSEAGILRHFADRFAPSRAHFNRKLHAHLSTR